MSFHFRKAEKFFRQKSKKISAMMMIIIRPFHFVLFIRPFQRKNFKIESKSLTSESVRNTFLSRIKKI